MWNYKKTNTESIKKSFESVNWKTLFNNKTVNKQVYIFNETIIKYFSNVVPNKRVTFDDNDPLWMSDFIKNDPMTNSKTYWSLLKSFYNGKKVPNIPSLLIDNKIISDFDAKANHFNIFLRLNVHL